MFHLIKKYSNRKLYDIHQKRFIKLEELADMVIRRDEVRVEDSDTHIDITSLEVSKALLKVTANGKAVTDLLEDLEKEKERERAEGYASVGGEHGEKFESPDVPYIPAEIRLLNKGLEYLRGCSEILQKEPIYNRKLHDEFCDTVASFSRKLGRLKKKFNIL